MVVYPQLRRNLPSGDNVAFDSENNVLRGIKPTWFPLRTS